MKKLSFMWWEFWLRRRVRRILRTESKEQVVERLKRAGLLEYSAMAEGGWKWLHGGV